MVGQSRLLAPPGQQLRLPVAHMVPGLPHLRCTASSYITSCRQANNWSVHE